MSLTGISQRRKPAQRSVYCCQPPPSALYSRTSASQFVPSDLSQAQLGVKQIAIRIQSVEQGIDSSLIPHVGQTRRSCSVPTSNSCCARISRTLRYSTSAFETSLKAVWIALSY